MAETAFGVINLTKDVIKMAVEIYKIYKTVEGHFKKQRTALVDKVDLLKGHLETLLGVLEKNQSRHNLADTSCTLHEIKELLVSIERFVSKLETYSNLKCLWKLWNIQNVFSDYNQQLDCLEKKLDNGRNDHSFIFLIEILNKWDDLEELQRELKGHSEVPGIENLNSQISSLKSERNRCSKGSIVPTIGPQDILKKTKLCRGMFGTIYSAEYEHEKVLVKYIDDPSDENVKLYFDKETENVMKFATGHIIRLYGICNKPEVKFLVLEFMELGSLSQVLHESKDVLSLNTRVSMALSAARGVYRFHTFMVHTALRTEKFLVDKNYNVKLNDMRYAKTFSSIRKHGSASVVPTLHYAAPEILNCANCTKESDIYSFGIILWEIFTNTMPFSTINSQKEPTLDQITTFVEEKRQESLTGDFYNDQELKSKLDTLVKQCRSFEPSERPIISKIVNKLEDIEEELEKTGSD